MWKGFTFAAAIVSASLSEASLSSHFLFCHSPFLFLVTTPLFSYQQLTSLPSPPQLLTLSLFFTPQGQELPLMRNFGQISVNPPFSWTIWGQKFHVVLFPARLVRPRSCLPVSYPKPEVLPQAAGAAPSRPVLSSAADWPTLPSCRSAYSPLSTPPGRNAEMHKCRKLEMQKYRALCWPSLWAKSSQNFSQIVG